MSFDLMLKSACGGCGSKNDLYGSNCKHLTLCSTCGKSMAENRAKCYECGATLTRLIREYNVRASSSSDKNYFIGRFATGLPNFTKKNAAENEWSLQKEGINGRQMTETLKEKLKNKPWLLEDETGQSQYHGHLEGAQSATYYLLMLQGKEFVAIPAGSWYNFNKVAQYRQLTIEEAEEKMKNRRKTVDGYERWMMKTAINGPAAFGHHPELIKDTPPPAKGRKKADGEDPSNLSDKGDDDEGEEAARKSRLALNKKGGDHDHDDDDDEGRRGGDFDDDDDNIEKGDDWEHEEIFTDDDEAVGNDPEEREDLLAPEVPAPPEIKEDDDDEEEESDEKEGKLSKSGKELKKLLGRSNGLNDSPTDEEDDGSGKRKKDEEDDDDDDDEDEDRPSPALAPKLKEPKEESTDAKSAAGGSSRGTPTSKSAKGKRKQGDDVKPASGAVSKKMKTENDVKPNVKEEGLKTGASSKNISSSSSKTGTSSAQGPVREEEIKAVLLQRAPLTTSELVATFKARLKSPEDKKAFADILKRISKIQKNNNLNYVVLRK